ncbi:baseplate J/gp47 family protein [Lachnoclostridium phytofermentans]|uniref:Putative phage tail protein n=1 Tax=Lachnoclostridium phytofermentans (strain ATCC 700394 / DSM 18823 / ISDg) TaxID=357809 RepID=A9KKK9_LACP7|nr:baseplate J/gp47 family protein [Lachnoclostridium phytofermentans]ABX41180.1 putative phage tail protein [Lachnoclostridium phytofermentans ISDg]
MYEEMTYETILSNVLAKVPADIDKREGSMIYTALAPACIELAQLYLELDLILNETFADTASRDYLVRRALERGIKPKEATYAVVRGEFNIDVPIGSRYSLDKFTYITKKKLSDGVYELECEVSGSTPNGSIGKLIPIEYIDGLETAMITEILIPGEDEEDTEIFRKRYLDSFDAQAFGGNRTDYKEKVLRLSGVGAVKVYRATNVSGEEAGGNVKLTILDSSLNKPSGVLVNMVQTAVDPTNNSGDGEGFAPLWHFVHVIGAEETKIDITTSITYQAGYKFEDLKSYIEEVIDGYFKNLVKSWQESDTLVVRISQIESAILGITGIIDVNNTSINGGKVNIELNPDSIPVRGSFNEN